MVKTGLAKILFAVVIKVNLSFEVFAVFSNAQWFIMWKSWLFISHVQ